MHRPNRRLALIGGTISTHAELAAVTPKDVTRLGDLIRKVGATAE